MSTKTSRQRAVAKALTLLLPMAPYSDIDAIRAVAGGRRMRDLPTAIAVWLAAVAHIRHVHTDYDDLLESGYDRDSARHFTVDPINEKLTEWRATRLLEPDADDGDDIG